MVGIVLLGVFVLLLAFGAPIAVCLGMSSVGAILVQGAGKPLDAIMSVLPRLCSSASSKFVLLAIPFFILSGNVMEKAGISGRLINLAEKCLGHIRGGMAMVCVVVSCFFAAISGSGPATVAALGLIMIPALKKAGYSPAFACALMAAGGAIGVVIPPSITFVVYGSIADASITDLFKAGVIPGLLMGLGLIVAALFVGRKANLTVQPKASGKERLKACLLGPADARDHPGRYLWQHLHPHRGRRCLRVLWPDRGRVHLSRGQLEEDEGHPHRLLLHHRHGYVHHHGRHPVRLCPDPCKTGSGH